MDTRPLQDRVAIVTGASSGIGRGIALELAREGARIVVADLQEQPKQGSLYEQGTATTTATEVERLGSEAHFVCADVSDASDVKGLVAECVGRFGRLDILVNNAGIGSGGPTQTLAEADWDRVIDVNVKGVLLTSQASLPHLRESPAGRIINIASVNAYRGGLGPDYTASKAAVANMTRDVAVEIGANGVTANSISPGAIGTAMQTHAEMLEKIRRVTPLGSIGMPRDIGRACVFLASDDAAWITGVDLPVDGGLLCGWTMSLD